MLKMNVRGTILSERPHVGKVLSQIPGLTAESNGEASLIGGGTLVTFINGVYEIVYDVDGNPKAYYIQQARNGFFTREAIICNMLSIDIKTKIDN